MKILIAGSHGIVGSAVTPYLIACGHQISRLVRSTPGRRRMSRVTSRYGRRGAPSAPSPARIAELMADLKEMSRSFARALSLAARSGSSVTVVRMQRIIAADTLLT